MAALRWFDDAVAAFFVLRIVIALAIVAVTVSFLGMQVPASLPWPLRPFLGRYTTPGIAHYAEALSTFFAAVLATIGVARLRSNRLEAFCMFQRSILVTILLTQVFEFYRRQLLAMVGLAFHIALLVAVHYMIEGEKERAGPEAAFA